MAKRSSRSECRALDLEHFGPFLINSLTRRFNTRLDKAFRNKGLGIHDWRLLATLANTPLNRPVDIADYIATDPSTLSRVIDRFVEAGAVRRHKPSGEARVTELELTKSGQSLYEAALMVVTSECERMLAALTVKESAEFNRLLLKLCETYEPAALLRAALPRAGIKPRAA